MRFLQKVTILKNLSKYKNKNDFHNKKSGTENVSITKKIINILSHPSIKTKNMRYFT